MTMGKAVFFFSRRLSACLQGTLAARGSGKAGKRESGKAGQRESGNAGTRKNEEAGKRKSGRVEAASLRFIKRQSAAIPSSPERGEKPAFASYGAAAFARAKTDIALGGLGRESLRVRNWSVEPVFATAYASYGASRATARQSSLRRRLI